MCVVFPILFLQVALADAHEPIKFHYWYASASETIKFVSMQCSWETEGYRNKSQLSPPPTPCGLAQNCLIENLPEYSKANYAAAGVLLDPMPTMLGFAGAGLRDTATNTIQRPLLSSLMVAGASALSPIPLLSSVTDRVGAKPPPALMLALGRHLAPGGASSLQLHYERRALFSIRTIVPLSTIQYLLALLALANTIHNAVELDVKSTVI
jgi:hypothetical protein